MLALLHLGSIAVDLILSANTELNVEGTSVHADSWIQIPTGATLNLLNATNVSADQIIVENGGVLRFWHGCASCSGGTYNWALLNSSGVVASIVNNVEVRSGGVIEGAGLTIQAGAFSIEEGGITTADGVGYPSDYGPEGLCNVASCSCQCVGAGGGSSHARSGGGGYGGAGGNGAGWDVVGQAELAPAKHTRVLPTKPQPRAPPPKPLPPSLPPTEPSPPPPWAPPRLLRSAPRARMPQQHGRRMHIHSNREAHVVTAGFVHHRTGRYWFYCPQRWRGTDFSPGADGYFRPVARRYSSITQTRCLSAALSPWTGNSGNANWVGPFSSPTDPPGGLGWNWLCMLFVAALALGARRGKHSRLVASRGAFPPIQSAPVLHRHNRRRTRVSTVGITPDPPDPPAAEVAAAANPPDDPLTRERETPKGTGHAEWRARSCEQQQSAVALPTGVRQCLASRKASRRQWAAHSRADWAGRRRHGNALRSLIHLVLLSAASGWKLPHHALPKQQAATNGESSGGRRQLATGCTLSCDGTTYVASTCNPDWSCICDTSWGNSCECDEPGYCNAAYYANNGQECDTCTTGCACPANQFGAAKQVMP